MSSIDLIQIPVTGRERGDNPREAAQALSQFYRALNTRNLGLMQQAWDNSAEASMDNPLGGIKRGWDDIKSLYEKLFDSKAAYQFELHDYALREAGDVFYVTGRERGEVTLPKRPLQLSIRTTRLFRRNGDGQWRQVHHHGSIDDPAMLSAYQEAMLGGTPALRLVLMQGGA